jgi:hypothetical protein
MTSESFYFSHLGVYADLWSGKPSLISVPVPAHDYN